ncbi:MAG: hypothetical protein BGO87_11495 [Flavobacteriia bacterium 40-80]|nr:MAG: hypothetical protein BGO87_11495 [Flavobacteriia bacterium 40-80]
MLTNSMGILVKNPDMSSKLHTDENTVRITAAQIVLLAVIALWTQWPALAAFLAVDFAIRAFSLYPSPLALLSKSVVKPLKLEPHPIFAPPKKFAAGIGFVFSLVITLLLYFKLITAAYLVGGILIFCAVLESVFKICLGCYVYNWIVAPVVNRTGK